MYKFNNTFFFLTDSINTFGFNQTKNFSNEKCDGILKNPSSNQIGCNDEQYTSIEGRGEREESKSILIRFPKISLGL